MTGLLAPKLRTLTRRLGGRGSVLRGVVLGGVGLAFWALLLGVLYRLLVYFRGVEEIGALLATKLLGLILLAFLAILLLSNVITALSSFFLSGDLEFFRAAPVDELRFYGARLAETLLHSSWMVALVLAPVLVAYGWVFGGGWPYVAVSAATLVAFLVLPAVVGTALTLVLVNVFPARRARDLLTLIALLGAGGLVFLLRLLRPEQLTSPGGFQSLVGFVAALKTPSSVWLPSQWAADALMAPLRAGTADLFPLLLLVSTAAAFVVLGSWLHGRLYWQGFTRAQEGAKLREDARGGRLLERLLGPVRTRSRALVAKDIRSFFRDTTQWSQLILLAVLVVVYVYNVRVLPLHTGQDVGFFLTNVVAFLNLGLAGFVLAAIAARFLFPAVSLEGRTLWLLRSSPLDLRALLWSKYWVGTLPLLALALVLTFATNRILEVGGFMMTLSLVTITAVTFAIAALALGFGALFPRFDADNAADVSTGYGGLLFMMTATAYLAAVIVLEAWPVYSFLRARAYGNAAGGPERAGLVIGVGGALALSAVAVVWPLRLAARRMEAVEA